MRIKSAVLLVIAVAMLAYYFQQRRHRYEARTAKEFVAKWVAAHDNKDVDGVLALTAQRRISPGKAAAEKSELGRQVIALYEARQRDELIQAFKDNDRWVQAASRMHYQGERIHGDHIHLQVSISYAPSEMILVWENGTLKLAPDPSNYD